MSDNFAEDMNKLLRLAELQGEEIERLRKELEDAREQEEAARKSGYMSGWNSALKKAGSEKLTREALHREEMMRVAKHSGVTIDLVDYEDERAGKTRADIEREGAKLGITVESSPFRSFGER